MIAPPPGVRVWVAAGVTDMRKGFDGLAALVQQHLGQDAFSGQLFAIPRQAWRSGESVELGRSRSVSLCQADGKGPFRLRRKRKMVLYR